MPGNKTNRHKLVMGSTYDIYRDGIKTTTIETETRQIKCRGT